jgi:CRP-like cAMP-binding protein
LIVKSAREKEFEQAEALRDKLFGVDSMALNEIVKSGEIIEAEKSKAIDKSHLNTWSRFYQNLTQEETNTLFYGMRTFNFSENQMIMKQGEIHSRLYFIDEGRLKMVYRQADKTILLKNLGAGDIIGGDTFFSSDAFCTTSVITGSQVKLRVLEKENLEKLKKKSPGLESKINDYCLELESVSDLLKAKKLERRTKKRLNLPGKVLAKMVVDHDETEEKPLKGELLDISAPGMAFIIKTTPGFASLLLGSHLNLTLTFAELASDMKITAVGEVVAVNKEPFNEYVIHVEFSRSLNPLVIHDLEDMADT